MSISRRQFNLGAPGAAAGFILPKESDVEIVVYDYGCYQLHLGDPNIGPPAMTYREYAI